MPYALVIHGGAGPQPGKDYSQQKADLGQLIDEGQKMLLGGRDAVSVVAEIVAEMEGSGLYVAGKGTAPNSVGTFELDASIMDGRERRAGAVAAIQGIKHPILAALAAMKDDRHVMYAGAGAASMARLAGLAEVKDTNTYYSEHLGHGSADDVAHGTVGAVALDLTGALAAGTSTGGTFNKTHGRVGDTPLIGAGTWADQAVAVSSTGVGEAYIRTAAAFDVSARMRYGGHDVDQAARAVLDEVLKCDGDGGLIAVDAAGNISMPFNSHGMKRAAVSDRMDSVVRVFEPEP
jgi:isoaspartyl peptidase/L-asparaginase-like protein (Ntn-hydrolase superfamily)